VHLTASQKRNVYVERLKGYKAALADSGINYDENLVLVSNLSDQAGAEAAMEILKMDPLPDGIFSANDSCAVSCLRSLKASGIDIPRDIAIAGFNNDPLSKVIEPNLTTVDYPGREMGEAAAMLLIRKLAKGDPFAPFTMMLQHNLIIRDSSLKKI
jgi:LacI family transcriptional regulator